MDLYVSFKLKAQICLFFFLFTHVQSWGLPNHTFKHPAMFHGAHSTLTCMITKTLAFCLSYSLVLGRPYFTC